MFQMFTISWVRTNVRNVQQFLGYLPMFQVSSISCSKRHPVSWVLNECPNFPISWVRTNVLLYTAEYVILSKIEVILTRTASSKFDVVCLCKRFALSHWLCSYKCDRKWFAIYIFFFLSAWPLSAGSTNVASYVACRICLTVHDGS